MTLRKSCEAIKFYCGTVSWEIKNWFKMGKVKTKLKHQTSRKKILNQHGSSGQELHNQVFEECKHSRVNGFIFVFYKVFLRTVKTLANRMNEK